jgi:hypothetical protein
MDLFTGIINPKNQMRIEVQNRAEKPDITNSVKIISTIHIIAIFIRSPNNPKVIILNGRVIKLIIGLIKRLIKPKTLPTRIKILIPSLVNSPLVISTPGINKIAK